MKKEELKKFGWQFNNLKELAAWSKPVDSEGK